MFKIKCVRSINIIIDSNADGSLLLNIFLFATIAENEVEY